jgi:hypothetical protein
MVIIFTKLSWLLSLDVSGIDQRGNLFAIAFTAPVR